MPTYQEALRTVSKAIKDLDDAEYLIDGKPCKMAVSTPFLNAMSFVEGVVYGVLKGVTDPAQLEDTVKFAESVVAYTITQGAMSAQKQNDEPGGYA